MQEVKPTPPGGVQAVRRRQFPTTGCENTIIFPLCIIWILKSAGSGRLRLPENFLLIENLNTHRTGHGGDRPLGSLAIKSSIQSRRKKFLSPWSLSTRAARRTNFGMLIRAFHNKSPEPCSCRERQNVDWEIPGRNTAPRKL